MKYILLACLFAGSISANAQSLAPRDGHVELPVIMRLPVKRILYQSPPRRWNPMGDGFSAYVAEIAPEDLKTFVEQYAQDGMRWTKGSLGVLHLYGMMLDWLEKWMVVEKVKGDIEKIVPLQRLRDAPALYIRAEFKERPSDGKGRDFTDVTLWIIDPVEHQVIMFSENT